MTLTDAQIEALTPAERADLIRRLHGPVDLTHLPIGRRRLRFVRLVRLSLMITGTIVLIPWVAYLAVTLPDGYRVDNWRATWVGFDALLLTLMATTVVLGLMRRQLVVLTAFATGVLLVCDAWFDVMTADPDDQSWSIVTALVIELPIAALLIFGTVRLLRTLGATLHTLQPVARALDLRLPDDR